MKTLKKRLFTGALAGALAFTLSVPAFAGSTTPNRTTNITGAYEDITIDVMVPTTGEAQINPYALPVNLDTNGTNKISGEQIVTKPLAIANKSSVDLNVSATVTTTATGDLTLATTAPAATVKTKSAFVYMQMKHSEMTNSDVAASNGVSGFTAATINAEAEAWTQPYNAAKDLLLNGAKEATKENMIVLAKAGAAGAIQTHGVALFRLAGQVVADPTEAWTTRDGFTASVAFTFRPNTTAATIDKPEVTLATTTGTDTLTVSLEGANIVSVDWTSDDAAVTVAAVADPANGSKATVTGVSSGNATITAEITADNGLTYTVESTVTAP